VSINYVLFYLFPPFAELYSYAGPGIVMDTKIAAYVGEISAPSGICMFCCKVYSKVSVHICASHPGEERIVDIRQGPKHLHEAAMEMVLREGNNRNNMRVLATGCGVFIPGRRSLYTRSLERMCICCHCCMGIERTHLNRHLRTCSQAQSTAEGCANIDKEMPSMLK
jgi:hypothetical protein